MTTESHIESSPGVAGKHEIEEPTAVRSILEGAFHENEVLFGVITSRFDSPYPVAVCSWAEWTLAKRKIGPGDVIWLRTLSSELAGSVADLGSENGSEPIDVVEEELRAAMPGDEYFAGVNVREMNGRRESIMEWFSGAASTDWGEDLAMMREFRGRLVLLPDEASWEDQRNEQAALPLGEWTASSDEFVLIHWIPDESGRIYPVGKFRPVT